MIRHPGRDLGTRSVSHASGISVYIFPKYRPRENVLGAEPVLERLRKRANRLSFFTLITFFVNGIASIYN